jgi:hypothetical protein
MTATPTSVTPGLDPRGIPAHDKGPNLSYVVISHGLGPHEESLCPDGFGTRRR